jgi:hypothetical protein
MVSELLRTLNEMDRARDKIMANLSTQIETEKSLLKKRPSNAEPTSHT